MREDHESPVTIAALKKAQERIQDLETQRDNASELADKREKNIIRFQNDIECLRKTYEETVNKYLVAQAGIDRIRAWWAKYGEEEDPEFGRIYHVPTPEEMDELAKALNIDRGELPKTEKN